MPERYGRPSPAARALLGLLVLVVVGGGLGWLVRTAVQQSSPDVDAGVVAFEVISEQRTDVTVDVVRAVTTAVSCEVYAQAADKQVVGEQLVELPVAPAGTERVAVTIRTERRATTADVRSCSAAAG